MSGPALVIGSLALNPEDEVLMGNLSQVQPFVQKRVASIDALRGFDMFWIAGGERIIHAIYKVWPNGATKALDAQFEHVPWVGFHFYDLIFALFVFMVGVVLPFSLTRRMEEGANRGQLYRHIFQRFLTALPVRLDLQRSARLQHSDPAHSRRAATHRHCY